MHHFSASQAVVLLIAVGCGVLEESLPTLVYSIIPLLLAFLPLTTTHSATALSLLMLLLVAIQPLRMIARRETHAATESLSVPSCPALPRFYQQGFGTEEPTPSYKRRELEVVSEMLRVRLAPARPRAETMPHPACLKPCPTPTPHLGPAGPSFGLPSCPCPPSLPVPSTACTLPAPSPTSIENPSGSRITTHSPLSPMYSMGSGQVMGIVMDSTEIRSDVPSCDHFHSGTLMSLWPLFGVIDGGAPHQAVARGAGTSLLLCAPTRL